MKKKKQKDEYVQAFFIVLLVFILVVLVVGITYGVFNYSREGENVNKITTGTITMDYIEGDNIISIDNAIPLVEEAGKVLSKDNEMYDFTISTKTSAEGIIYEVVAVKQDDSTLANESVRLYLQSATTAGEFTTEVLQPTAYTPLTSDDSFGGKAGEMVLTTQAVTTDKTTYYRLRMWVDKSYVLTGESKKFSVKVKAYGKNATPEEITALQ